MNKLQRYLPNAGGNAAKLVKDKARWMASRAERWDWDKMRWPDGSRIEVKDRKDVMENVYNTLATDGASKIDAKA
ncbi:hypothetical protein OE165_28670, partial [Escherichia coli]|uniref:hypothetical protein n=1 Tax=Escherichia coli TaxID=562 RepID=UPI0021F2A717